MTTSRIVATSDLSSQSSTGRVLEAVQELHALEQIVTREALIELLDLPATTIDDRVGTLVNAGMIVRVRRGIYAPAEVHDAARVISKTILPCGTVKIDIGDDVLTLTPKEDRMLAAMLAGVAMLLKGLRDISVPGGIAHAFNGSLQQAQAFIALGFRLGFGGAVTYDRALQLRRLAAELPESALVLETDAPDIPPHWLYTPAEQRAAGQPQGRNAPAELPRIAEVVAGLRGMPVAELARSTSANACAALPRLAGLVQKV